MKTITFYTLLFTSLTLLIISNANAPRIVNTVIEKANSNSIFKEINNPPVSITYNNPVLETVTNVPIVGPFIKVIENTVRLTEGVVFKGYDTYINRN